MSSQRSPSITTPSSTSNLPSANMGRDDKKIKKRNRVPLSCAPCRIRKLKCNRSLPCENCIKRGDTGSCHYATPTNRRKASRVTNVTSPDELQNRIVRLEDLVLSLMTKNNGDPDQEGSGGQEISMNDSSISNPYSQSPSQPDGMFPDGPAADESAESETDKMAQSFGVLHFNNNKSVYMGEAHWATILNHIAEVKNYFGEHQKQYDEAIRKVEASKKQAGIQFNGPAFLLGGKNTPQLSDLLASLPGRDAVDKMVGRYFNDYDPATHVLHLPSWRRTYDKHWSDPEHTTPAFLGQLFAICGLAMQSYHRSQDEPYEYRGRTLALASNYRMLTQQCLLLADYVKPEHQVLETFILHLHGEYSKAYEVDVGIWVLTGMVVRLAMRTGLHRDSKHYAGISAFQGEIRRRIWAFVRSTDIMFSFQVGLPSMIRAADCDTELPRNLQDEDFDEDTPLPDARPVATHTSISYLLAKSQLTAIFGRIVECTQSVQPVVYEEVMRLDRELLETYHELPPCFQMKPWEESMVDPVATVRARFTLSMLFNKAVCVLHRKYLTRARETSRYVHSRRSCIDASAMLLRHHEVLYRESQPGHRLHRGQWYAATHISHDFILAATLACLDLLHSAQAEATGQSTGDIDMWGADRQEEMMQAVGKSKAIWAEQKDRFIEAFKANEMVGVMLQKIQAIRAQTTARLAQGLYNNNYSFKQNKQEATAAANGGAQQYSPPEEEKPEHSAAITLGMLSSGGVAGSNGQTTNGASTTAAPGFNGAGGPYPPTPSSSANANMTDAHGTTGLTPMADTTANNAPSPYTFFNGVGSELPNNLDWAALDSYIAGSNIDVGGMTEPWLQNIEIPPANIDGNAASDGDESQQLNNNLFANNNPALFPPGTQI